MSLYNDKINIIDTNRFNLDASNIVHQELDDSKSKKIIVTGPGCSGKTTSLMSYEKVRLNSNNHAIYMLAEEKDYDFTLSSEILIYKYELIITNKLFEYIRKYHNNLYTRKYLYSHKALELNYEKLQDYIKGKSNNCQILSLGELLLPMIERMKNDLETDEVTLIMDRYDLVGSSSKRFQSIATSLLEMFDKYIITSDDRFVYNNGNKRKLLLEKEYDLINVDYGKNFEIAKDIVSKDIKYWLLKNRVLSAYISFEDISDIISEEAYIELVKRCNGNFGMLFDSIRPFFDFYYVNYKNHDENVLKYQENSTAERNNMSKRKAITFHVKEQRLK